MKRKTTFLLIAICLLVPFSCFLPTVLGQDEEDPFVIGTLQNYVNFDPIVGEGGVTAYTRGWCFESLYHIENWDPDAASFYIVPWLVESESSDDSGLHINQVEIQI